MLDALTEPFSYDFMQRALLSACLLGISGGLLGGILILRRLALMGDALSHSLLPGIALAYLVFGPSTPALLAGALFAGLLTALGSALLSRLTRVKEDAAFGSLFVVLFGAGVALASMAKTRINLLHFLFGNILGVGNADLLMTAFTCLLTVAIFLLFHRPIILETFDPIFHRATGGHGSLVHFGLLTLVVLNLVAALQTMGIVLSLGLFLLPAVSAYLWCDRMPLLLIVSSTLAVVSAFCGILLSYHLGIPSGSSIVLCLGAIFLLSAIVSPTHGLLARLRS